jgi:FKBP-type peptidyl-prolyl cis-trans isomerase
MHMRPTAFTALLVLAVLCTADTLPGQTPGAAAALPGPARPVRIHETLSLPDGRVIFTSRRNNQPVKFVLGASQVIAGVDEGVTGMRVGERRKLLVPPSLDGRTFDPAFIPPDAIRH